MKKTILFLITVYAIISCEQDNGTKNKDQKGDTRTVHKLDGYGKSRWGMTPEELKEKYPDVINMMKEANAFVLESQQVAGRKAGISFVFENEKLVGASVTFKIQKWEQGHAGQRELKKHTDFHNGLLTLLTEKYGRPERSGKVGAGGTNPITGGILDEPILWSHWEVGKTVVALVCFNSSCTATGPMIIYSSSDLHPLPEKAVKDGL